MKVRRTPPRFAAALLGAALLAAAAAAPAQKPPDPAPPVASGEIPKAPPPPASPPSSAPPARTALPARTAPSASASAPRSPSATVEAKGAPVNIHGKTIFEIAVPRGKQSAVERAAEATKVIEHLLEEGDEGDVRVVEDGDVAFIYGGKGLIVTLGPEDAAAAGHAAVAIQANLVAADLRAAVRAERQRSAIATTVFAFSLLVFSGLIAFLLVRKVGELFEKLRSWLDANPGKLPALKVQGIEVVQPAAVRGGLAVAVSAAVLVARIGILYAWLLIALSLFDATRGYSEKLTGFVLKPVSDMTGRVASALPLLVIAGCTVLAVGVSLRFVRLFFGSMARGETTVGWMPRDLAEPTSILVRGGIIVTTLVVAAPLITGSDDGTLSRAGVVALVAIGLAVTPILACAATGVAIVFGRHLRVGDHAGVGGREGRVRALTMLEVLLEDDLGSTIRVPHILSLWHPTSVTSAAAPVSVEVTVDGSTDLARALEVMRKAAGALGRARVEVLGLDADGAHVRVAVAPRLGADRNALYCALSVALQGEGVALGRRGPSVRAA